MFSVSIIGVGRVGGALALALPTDKYSVENLVFRDASNAARLTDVIKRVPGIYSFDNLTDVSTDVVFITTQDGRIEQAAREMVGKIRNSPIVFHTSGSLASTVLDDLKPLGCRTGSIHPLVSISRADLGPARFRDAYFCVEGDAEAVATGKQIVEDLGGRPFFVETKFKTLYHAAAVTACGHLVALFDAAVEMMTKCGLSAEEAKTILMPLVTSTVQNLAEQPTPAALTGTFARADAETFTQHLTALNANVSDDLLEIYLLLGERSLELAAKQGVSADRIERLRAKVSIAKSKLKW